MSLDRGSDWHLTATATAGVSTVTRAAPPVGQVNYVTFIGGTNSAAAALLMTLKDGAVTIGNFHVQASGLGISFSSPLRLHGAVELSLAAGAGGVVGAVNLNGFTR